NAARIVAMTAVRTQQGPVLITNSFLQPWWGREDLPLCTLPERGSGSSCRFPRPVRSASRSVSCLKGPKQDSKQTRRIDMTTSDLSRRGLLGAPPAEAGCDPSHPALSLRRRGGWGRRPAGPTPPRSAERSGDSCQIDSLGLLRDATLRLRHHD